MHIAAVILAAGASRRMGQPKALATLDGITFARRLVTTLTAANCAPLVMVTHAGLAEPLRVESVPARLVVNPTPENGMQSSLVCGLQALHDEPLQGVALVPVDQPHLRTNTVRQLLEVFRVAPDHIVLPVSGGRRGHPVVFPWALRHELCTAEPQGVRAVVWRHADRVLEVAVDDPACLANVNTPADLAALQIAWASRSAQRGEVGGNPPHRP